MAVFGSISLALACAGCSGNETRGQEVAEAIASGRLDEAKLVVDRWLDRQPNATEALVWAARVAIARDQADEAAEHIRRAQELGLNRADFRDIEGVVLARSGRYDEAEPLLLSHLAETRQPSPTAVRALANLGMATFRFGTARGALERWRRDEPDNAEPWLLEAEISWRIGEDAERIIAAYREALRRDPNLAAARLGLAEVLQADGQNDEAAAEFDIYLGDHPDDAKALAAAGLNELPRSNLDVAKQFLTRAVEHDPKQVDALKGLARIAQQSGQFAEALDHLSVAEEVDPYNHEIVYQQSLVLARLGQSDEAERKRQRSNHLRAQADQIGALRDALIRDPDNVDLQHRVARWLIENGQAEEGIRWAEKALKDHPGHRPLCLLLVNHYEAIGQTELANFYRWQADTATEEADRP
jgi:tetratricopeptide (TPR) repeat protein